MSNNSTSSVVTNAKTGNTPIPEKFVYFFSAGDSEGHAGMKNTLGGKGANLAEMTSLGIPVPPGFTISTDICTHFYEAGGRLPDWVKPAVDAALRKVEAKIGKKFGDVKNPLLVSVRSGARASMPGMMDTILNLGLNDQTVEGLATSSNNPRFAWDSYRRFIQMYSDVVLGMNASFLDVTFEDLKEEKKYKLDTDLQVEDLKFLVKKFKTLVQQMTGRTFPDNPEEQLWGAISAVFHSWNTPRAITYRELHSIPASWGTAVNIQSMVFGNMGEDSATGVAFTRDPSTGEKYFYGEFLINAQGEDVVAGIRTPQPITKKAAEGKSLSLEEAMPVAYGHLVEIYKKLEAHYRDMQDIEFTIERGQLWMLQTRNGKRAAKASLKIACDMIDEKLITVEEALLRIDPASLDQLLHPTLDPKATKTLLAKGLPASPGGVHGQIVFSSEEAVEWREKGHKVILVRIETSPEDIAGMVASQGILTTRGGMTSHAAVVARGMGKCCVACCGEVEVDYRNETLKAKGYLLKKGD
ncbi:MAG: pyruvate, phosphate dikinase, partial [Pseudobdellovibrionaceae bacterium]